ncbi:hypothetical protein [Marinoscillum sp.]|uniref:hypothetical protein n=1 Tax=Marinoscillum sp. TaxID=2024838 RepID=UPI003BABFC09
MKYYYLLTIAAIFIFTSHLNAQEKFSSIRSSANPANTMLGLQPSNILKPKTYDALEVALFSNAFDGNNLVIPNDFSLEFSPYWFKNHSLVLEDYLVPESPFAGLWRSSSFSIASTQNFLLQDSTATNALALGYRTTLYFGSKNDKTLIKAYIQQIKSVQNSRIIITSQLELLPDTLSESNLKQNIRQIISPSVISHDKIDEFVEQEYQLYKSNQQSFNDKLIDVLYATDNALFTKFESYIQNRPGLSVDLAFANTINFPTNEFETVYAPRYSLWITPSVQFKDNLDFFKLIGVLRYEWYDEDFYSEYFPDREVFQNNFDYGLSVDFSFDKINFQFEAIGRSGRSEIPVSEDANGNTLYRKDTSSDSQYIGSLSYNINETLVLTYSLGKRFEPFTTQSNLVSLLGLNLGLGVWEKE